MLSLKIRIRKILVELNLGIEVAIIFYLLSRPTNLENMLKYLCTSPWKGGGCHVAGKICFLLDMLGQNVG
jgi:hypothetical protein